MENKSLKNKTDELHSHTEELKNGSLHQNPAKLKKTASLGYNINMESPRAGPGGAGNDSDSNRSSGGSGMYRLNQRLLSKEVQERIKEEHESPPVTGNTLANYRNFKLQT